MGSKVRYYRQKKAVSIQELAEKIGVHPCTITSIEHNKQKTFRPTLFRILCKIADYFNVEWEAIADDYVKSVYGDFAEKLKIHLNQNHMAQAEFARLLSVHEQTVAAWITKKDKPSRNSWELMRHYGII